VPRRCQLRASLRFEWFPLLATLWILTAPYTCQPTRAFSPWEVARSSSVAVISFAAACTAPTRYFLRKPYRRSSCTKAPHAALRTRILLLDSCPSHAVEVDVRGPICRRSVSSVVFRAARPYQPWCRAHIFRYVVRRSATIHEYSRCWPLCDTSGHVVRPRRSQCCRTALSLPATRCNNDRTPPLPPCARCGVDAIATCRQAHVIAQARENSRLAFEFECSGLSRRLSLEKYAFFPQWLRGCRFARLRYSFEFVHVLQKIANTSVAAAEPAGGHPWRLQLEMDVISRVVLVIARSHQTCTRILFANGAEN
jgi:hypothetical protein